MIGEILQAAGVDAVVAGNIGTPVCDVLRERDPHTLVLELSSFQLDTTDEFRVDVAVLAERHARPSRPLSPFVRRSTRRRRRAY